MSLYKSADTLYTFIDRYLYYPKGEIQLPRGSTAVKVTSYRESKKKRKANCFCTVKNKKDEESKIQSKTKHIYKNLQVAYYNEMKKQFLKRFSKQLLTKGA